MGVQYIQAEGIYSHLLGLPNPLYVGLHETCHSWKHEAVAEAGRAPAMGGSFFKTLLGGEETSIPCSRLYSLNAEDSRAPLMMISAEINAAPPCLPPSDKSPIINAAQTTSPASAAEALPSSACTPKAKAPATDSHVRRCSDNACPASEGMGGARDKKANGAKSSVRAEKRRAKEGGQQATAWAAFSGQMGRSVKPTKLPAEPPEADYVHVRARRGQATDSHSLAERVRREKISERMRFLQDLVPGCSKITGKALVLDEIINYVQSLQNQVEFLAMRLGQATINPNSDHTIFDSSKEQEMASPSMEEEQDGIYTNFYLLDEANNLNPSIVSDLSTSTCNDSNLTHMDFSH